MAPGTYQNGDIQRIHERMDGLEGQVNGRIDSLRELVDAKIGTIFDRQIMLSNKLTEVATTIKMQQPTPPPARPCIDLSNLTIKVQDHLVKAAEEAKEAQETRRIWQRPTVGAIIHLLELAVIGLLGWALASTRLVAPPSAAGDTVNPPAETTQPRAGGSP